MSARRPMPAGRQLGLLWGSVAAAMLALSPFAERIAASFPACPLRGLTGVPCPGCGSGGAAVALARLDVTGALAASPLAAAAWIGLVAGGLLAGLAALRGFALPELPARLGIRARASIAAVVVANWGWVIATRLE